MVLGGKESPLLLQGGTGAVAAQCRQKHRCVCVRTAEHGSESSLHKDWLKERRNSQGFFTLWCLLGVKQNNHLQFLHLQEFLHSQAGDQVSQIMQLCQALLHLQPEQHSQFLSQHLKKLSAKPGRGQSGAARMFKDLQQLSCEEQPSKSRLISESRQTGLVFNEVCKS